MYEKNNTSFAKCYCFLIGLIVILFVFQSCAVSNSRDDRNMEVIKEGYCYDADTKIIYIESYSGSYYTNTTYTVYHDENGDVCKYDITTGGFVPVNKEEEIRKEK